MQNMKTGEVLQGTVNASRAIGLGWRMGIYELTGGDVAPEADRAAEQLNRLVKLSHAPVSLDLPVVGGALRFLLMRGVVIGVDKVMRGQLKTPESDAAKESGITQYGEEALRFNRVLEIAEMFGGKALRRFEGYAGDRKFRERLRDNMQRVEVLQATLRQQQ